MDVNNLHPTEESEDDEELAYEEVEVELEVDEEVDEETLRELAIKQYQQQYGSEPVKILQATTTDKPAQPVEQKPSPKKVPIVPLRRASSPFDQSFMSLRSFSFSPQIIDSPIRTPSSFDSTASSPPSSAHALYLRLQYEAYEKQQSAQHAQAEQSTQHGEMHESTTVSHQRMADEADSRVPVGAGENWMKMNAAPLLQKENTQKRKREEEREREHTEEREKGREHRERKREEMYGYDLFRHATEEQKNFFKQIVYATPSDEGMQRSGAERDTHSAERHHTQHTQDTLQLSELMGVLRHGQSE